MTEQSTLGPILAQQAPALCTGRLYEPRALYGSVTLPVGNGTNVGNLIRFDPVTFRNNERYPLHLTHLKWAVRERRTDQTVSTDEAQIQRINARLSWHDSFYMSADPMVLPLWHTQQGIALSQPIGQASAVWRFLRPVLLPTRASLECVVTLEQVLASGQIPLSVSFHGKGTVSRHARMFSGTAAIASTRPLGGQDFQLQITPLADFTNDGVEPVAITKMVLNVGPNSLNASPLGDLRLGRLSVRMVQGDTGQRWNVTPGLGTSVLLPASDIGMPIDLWGISGGRGCVHRIPDGGWILEPGRGFDMELQNLNLSGNFELDVGAAALGYLIIP